MKLAYLDPAMRAELAGWASTLTEDIKTLDAALKVLTDADAKDGKLQEEYAVLRAQGAGSRKVALELSAIKMEREMLAEAQQKNGRKVVKASGELKSNFYPACQSIKNALAPLLDQVREQYLEAAAPFYLDAKKARAQAEQTDLYEAASTFYRQCANYPLALHDPDAIRSYAEYYLRAIEAILEGEELFAFPAQPHTHEEAIIL